MGVASDFGVRLLSEVTEAAARPLSSKQKAGRPRSHPHPVQVAPLHRADAVLASQPEITWHTITWRMGSTGPLTKQFSALRDGADMPTTPAQRAGSSASARCRSRRASPSSIGAVCPRRPRARLAELAHRRPGIERGYQDGKGQTGLGDYVARVWHSFHRQLTIEMLVHSWLSCSNHRPLRRRSSSTPAPCRRPTSQFFPYGRPVRQRGRRSASGLRILAQRIGPLVVQSGQIDIAVPAGRRRLRDGDHFASTVT